VIDFGTNVWYLSGPWRLFTTNSISFNTSGATSASIKLLGSWQLAQLDAFNGGSTSATVTISCAGQPAVQRVVAANQLATIATSWMGACDTVSLASSNGWDTNFDRLVLGATGPGSATSTPTPTPAWTHGAQSTPTPTRTATPTSTRTPTATSTGTPVPGAQTVTFNDLRSPNRVLSGQYPANALNWGTSSWYLSGAWGQFTTNSVSFNGAGQTSAAIAMVAPGRLVQLDAFNGGSTSSTITISCAGQPTVTSTLAAGQLRTIQTGWSGACTSVTLGSSNGWDTNFDNLVLG